MSRVVSRVKAPKPPPEDEQEETADANAVTIRRLIWLYFILLVVEGAFRKWITPGLSNPLLIVRDPVVIAIYFFALTGQFFPGGRYILALFAVMAAMLMAGLMAREFNPAVYLFGVRTNFLHLPLIFLIPKVMRYEDVLRMGKWVLLISIPMTVLVVMQFLLGPRHWINTSAGGTGHQLSTTGGKVRASGTFSFITGVVAFYSVVTSFVLAGFLQRRVYPLWLLAAASVATVLAVSTSGSRSAVLMLLLICGGTLLASFLDRRYMGRVIAAMALFGVVALLVGQLDFVQQGVVNLNARFTTSGGRAGIYTRIFGQFTGSFAAMAAAPFFGTGLGLGTNVGASLATGHVSFLLAEGEWERIILESGPFAGGLFIVWRVAVLFHLMGASWRAVRQDENLVPLLILSACGMLILNGQLGQPNTLGFAALGGGLCLAATRRRAIGSGGPRLPERPRIRGRSSYAQHLHGPREERKGHEAGGRP